MDKNFDNNLNDWLSAIIGLNAIFALIAVCRTVWDLFSGDSEGALWYSIYDIAVQMLFIFGCIKLFFASRVGFYVMVSACLINIVTGVYLFFHYGGNSDDSAYQILQVSALNMILFSIGKTVLLMLLMLLHYKGKNAYQVLWNKKA